MKILAINASFRGKRGFTYFLINKLFTGAREKKAECDVLNLSEYKLNHCIACQACQKKEHHLRCIFHDKDDVAFIFEKMRQADLIIFATPVYTFAMSSLLKTLFERFYGYSEIDKFAVTKSGLLFHHVENNLCQKPFVPLIVCDNLEKATPGNIIAYFQTYASFMDAPIAGTLVRKSAGMFQYSDAPESGDTSFSAIYEAYTQAGRELGQTGTISKATQIKANQPIIKIPFFVKPLLKLGIGIEKAMAAHHEITQQSNIAEQKLSKGTSDS